MVSADALLCQRLESPMRILRLLAPAVALGLAWPAAAATLDVQGVLRSAAGGPVADGDQVMIWKLYDKADAELPVWEETVQKVSVVSGYFAVTIGQSPTKAIAPALLTSGKPLWVGVSVGTEPELPRRQLPVSPAAWYAVNAGGLECTGCIKEEMIGVGAIGPSRVSFTYAGSKEKGGSANHALAADNAKQAEKALAADKAALADKAAVAESSLLADSAKKADLALAANKASTADEANGLQCTGCITPVTLSQAVVDSFVSAKGGTVGGDLTVTGKLMAKVGAEVSGALSLGTSTIKGGRFETIAVGKSPCDATIAGQVALDSATSRLHFCDGKGWLRLAVCSAECPPPETVACGQAIKNSCGDVGGCTGKGTWCPSGQNCGDTGCVALFGDSQQNPGASCAAILAKRPTAGDGVYWLDPDGGDTANAFKAFCDMTADGGGWTLAMRFKSDNTLGWASAYWTDSKLIDEDSGATLSPKLNLNGKFQAFLSAPGTTIRGCKADKGPCVQQAWSGNKTLLTLFGEGCKSGNLSRATLVGMFGDDGGQPNCNANGINCTHNYTGYRFGLSGNNEGDCNTSDASWGWGVYGSSSTASGCGCGLAGWSVPNACFQGTLWIK
jgi:hypothetical protein